MITPLRLIVIACVSLVVPVPISAADISAAIKSIEALPRKERFNAYESLADKRDLSDKERVQVIQSFAAHAKKVSPAYGRSSHPVDEERWERMLVYAHERDRDNTDVMVALCRLLINQQKVAEALPIAQAYLKADPGAHASQAYVAWCTDTSRSSSPVRKEPQTFPLHFCVLTRKPEVAAKVTRELCEREVEIFNEQFRSIDGRPLARFTLAGLSSNNDIRQSKSDLLEFGDSQEPYDSGRIVKAFNSCTDPKIRNQKAINVYIYDGYNNRDGFKDVTSHGTRNSNRPYLLIDWERLGGNIQNAEPHEMGHAFGLDHVGVPGAGIGTATNIMASAAETFGSGGTRELGFTPDQEALILYHAQRTFSRLGLAR